MNYNGEFLPHQSLHCETWWSWGESAFQQGILVAAPELFALGSLHAAEEGQEVQQGMSHMKDLYRCR